MSGSQAGNQAVLLLARSARGDGKRMDRKPVVRRGFSSSRRHVASSSSAASDPYHTSHRIPRTNSTTRSTISNSSTISSITRYDAHTTNDVMNKTKAVDQSLSSYSNQQPTRRSTNMQGTSTSKILLSPTNSHQGQDQEKPSSDVMEIRCRGQRGRGQQSCRQQQQQHTEIERSGTTEDYSNTNSIVTRSTTTSSGSRSNAQVLNAGPANDAGRERRSTNIIATNSARSSTRDHSKDNLASNPVSALQRELNLAIFDSLPRMKKLASTKTKKAQSERRIKTEVSIEDQMYGADHHFKAAYLLENAAPVMLNWQQYIQQNRQQELPQSSRGPGEWRIDDNKPLARNGFHQSRVRQEHHNHDDDKAQNSDRSQNQIQHLDQNEIGHGVEKKHLQQRIRVPHNRMEQQQQRHHHHESRLHIQRPSMGAMNRRDNQHYHAKERTLRPQRQLRRMSEPPPMLTNHDKKPSARNGFHQSRARQEHHNHDDKAQNSNRSLNQMQHLDKNEIGHGVEKLQQHSRVAFNRMEQQQQQHPYRESRVRTQQPSTGAMNRQHEGTMNRRDDQHYHAKERLQPQMSEPHPMLMNHDKKSLARNGLHQSRARQEHHHHDDKAQNSYRPLNQMQHLDKNEIRHGVERKYLHQNIRVFHDRMEQLQQQQHPHHESRLRTRQPSTGTMKRQSQRQLRRMSEPPQILRNHHVLPKTSSTTDFETIFTMMAREASHEQKKYPNRPLPTHSITGRVIEAIRKLPGNEKCIDCGLTESIPTSSCEGNDLLLFWASVTYGSILCQACAFRHVTKCDKVRNETLLFMNWILDMCISSSTCMQISLFHSSFY